MHTLSSDVSHWLCVASCQMLSLMDAQAQFFLQGHQSLSELDEYRQKLNEEVTISVLLHLCFG